MKRVLIFLLILVSIESVEAKKIFVKSDASGSNNGTSWTDAYNELFAAINASVSGDTILVAKGVYYPNSALLRDATFQPKPGTKIFGSFAGNEAIINSSIIDARDFKANTSILNGDIDKDGTLAGNAYHVVNFDSENPGSYTNTTEFDGFQIIGGNANGVYPNETGGGIFIKAYCGQKSSPKLRNLHITGNEAKSFAGGLYIGTGCSATGTEASPDIQHCTVEYNIAGRNHSTSYAGGIGINASLSLVNAVIDSCIIRFNSSIATSGYGGGIGLWAGGNNGIASVKFKNCLIYENEAAYTGNDIRIRSGNNTTSATDGYAYPEFINTTIYRKVGSSINCFNWGGVNSPKFYNTIIWNDNGNQTIYNERNTGSNQMPAPEFQNSILTASFAAGSWIATQGTNSGNNSNENPLLAEAGAGDFRLETGSPAIDAGNVTYGNNIGWYQGIGISPLPKIILSQQSIDFTQEVSAGLSSEVKSYYVKGANLTHSIEINPSSNFEVSLDSINFTNNIVLPLESDSVRNTKIYIRFTPGAGKSYSDSITHSSATARDKYLKASGTGKSPVFVNIAATGLADGSSWDNAYTTLWQALENASTGDMIVVAKGIYTPKNTGSDDSKLYLTYRLKLYGGFAGNETNLKAAIENRDFILNETVLSGDISQNDHLGITTDNAYQVVDSYGNEELVFDGFTIANAKAHSSFLVTPAMRLDNCENAQIRNLVFRNNQSSLGALYVFRLNNVLIENITAYDNRGKNAHAILIENSERVTVNGALIYNNEATESGSAGIVVDHVVDSIVIANVTVTMNISKGNSPFSYRSSYSNSDDILYLHNCIVYNNNKTDNYLVFPTGNVGVMNEFEVSYGLEPQISHSLIKGSGGSSSWIGEKGIDLGGNLDSDPFFASEAEKDFRPVLNSPALGTGNSTFGNNIGYFQDAIGINKTVINSFWKGVIFGNLPEGEISDTAKLSFNGINISENVQVHCSEGFEVRSSLTADFEESISITLPSGIVDSAIYVRMNSPEIGSKSGFCVLKSGNDSLIFDFKGYSIPNDVLIASVDTLVWADTILAYSEGPQKSFIISGINLSADNIFVKSNINTEVNYSYSTSHSLSATNGQINQEVFVNAYPLAVGPYLDSILLINGVDSTWVFLKGYAKEPSTPYMYFNSNSIELGNVEKNDTIIHKIKLSAGNMGINDSINIFLDYHSSEYAKISFNSVSGFTDVLKFYFDSQVDTTVYMRVIAPSNNAYFYGSIGASNPSITHEVKAFINGQTVDPFNLVISENNINFGLITNLAQITQSSYRTLELSTTYFVEPIVVAMPAGFEISTEIDINGNPVNYSSSKIITDTWKTLFIRFHPTALGIYSGTVIIEAGGISKSLDLYGEYSPLITSIYEENKVFISIYPNPTQNYIHIETGNERPELIRMYNISGTLIKTEHVVSKSTIDLSYLPSGIYFIESHGFKSKIIKH